MTTQLEKIPNGWQKRQIKDLLEYERPDKYIVESDQYIKTGTPVLTANKSFVLGYTDEKEGIYKDLPAVVFDDFTTDSKFVDFPFKVKSSAIKILKNKEGVDLRFVYEKMKSINFQTGSHKRYYISQYQNVDVLVPSLSEQKKIADILKTIDEEIQNTDKIIAAVEKLKRGLMQEFFIDPGWQKKKISDISHVVTGGTPRTSITEYWGGSIPWMASGEINLRRVNQTEKYITEKGLQNSNAQLLPIGTVMIALAGQGKTRGKVAVLDIETACNQSLAGVIADPSKLSGDFLFYNLEFRYQELRNISGGEGRTGLNLKLIKQLEVPLPPLKDQIGISSVLRSVDERIVLNQRFKKTLITLKKGLAQDLLSGKKRV